MARLSLTLLGPMQITLGGQPAGGFAYHKARAMLAYLAVEAGQTHQRDTLAALLWPELPDEAARHNLRQALANLRTVLGDASATPPFLHITRDTIQFNVSDSDSLDCSAFAALLTECERHVHRHPERCFSCATRLEQAVILYHGDFLAGFSVGDSAPFEEWLLRKRERLHQQALGALTRLAVFHERRGNHDQARDCAQRQIELEPWREEAHRQLMRLLAHSGQRSSALAQYESCRRILARDLGVEPEAATTALYEKTRDGAPRTEMRRPGTDQTRHAQLPTAPTPLIGRERDLAELGALLENPACRLITIVGPGGIGKTRLALAAAAEQADMFTDGATFVPLQPISSAAFLAPAILSALNIQPQGQRDPHEHVLAYLRDKELLLVLENFEHLLAPELSDGDGAPVLLADILRRAPGVTFLVTSRERLAMSDEWLFDLPSLAYPPGETVNAIESYSAVQLFLRRASQVRRNFAPAEDEARAVARICRLVEGLPLAIELAAAALHTRSCTAREEGDPRWVGDALFCVGLVAYNQGEYATAQALLEESLTLIRVSEHELGVTYPLNALGNLANLQGDYAAAQAFYQECLTIRRKLAYKRGTAATLADMGNVQTKLAQYPMAWALYQESLALYRELGNKRGLLIALSGLACLVQNQGQPLAAMRLLGAVEALLLQESTRLDEPQRSHMQHTITAARAQLDEASFAAAWAEGQHMPLEQAIAYALEMSCVQIEHAA